jgi:hypothetical protein
MVLDLIYPFATHWNLPTREIYKSPSLIYLKSFDLCIHGLFPTVKLGSLVVGFGLNGGGNRTTKHFIVRRTISIR